MEPSCIHHTLIPGASKLFCDYLYHFDQVTQFYTSHFSDEEALHRSIERIQYPASRRERLVSALRRQNGDSPALQELARPEAVAVVTGQQVGLFSGPAYTVFKALTAVKLAEHLKQQGVPAVPVFWLATEDHDLAEVDHAWVFNKRATAAKVSVANSVINGGPVGNVELGAVPIAELRESLGELPFREDAVRAIEQAYRPGVTLGAAFRAFLQEILKDFGLLYIDPLEPDIREISAELMRDVVDRVPDLTSALRRRDKELVDAGYHAQVLVEQDSSLLFLLNQNRRNALRWKDGRFVGKERSFTASELKEIAERLSPNALLRPVMQDYLLPTVTYIGGPSEIAYMAQSQVLYDSLLGRMPVLFPRNSFTLLDARATKLLRRYALHVTDLLDHQEKVKGRIAAKLVPAGINDQLASVRAGTALVLADLQRDLMQFDPTLESAAKKTAAKVLYQLDKLGRKTGREVLRRDERASSDAAYLIDLVYPHRHLQERFYSIVPFLAKHGLDLPQRIYEQAQLACPDHMIRTL